MTAPVDEFEELARVAYDAGNPLLEAGTHTAKQAWEVALRAAVLLDRKRQRERLLGRLHGELERTPSGWAATRYALEQLIHDVQQWDEP